MAFLVRVLHSEQKIEGRDESKTSMCTTHISKAATPDLPPLADLKAEPVNILKREVIVVQLVEDHPLRKCLEDTENLAGREGNLRDKVKLVSKEVAKYCGGSMRGSIVAETNRVMKEQKEKNNSNLVHLGMVSAGVCRHRSILFKLCCDRLNIPCRLVRGNQYTRDEAIEEHGGHVWNVVDLAACPEDSSKRDLKLCDVMQNPGKLYENSDFMVQQYHRRLRQGEYLGAGMVSVVNEECDEHRLSYPEWYISPDEVTVDRAAAKLGMGGFGTVYKAKMKDVQEVAVKILKKNVEKDSPEYMEFLSEVDKLSRLNHEHIVNFKGACYDNENQFIVTELMEGGSLRGAWREHPLEYAWTQRGLEVALDVAKGLQYMHAQVPCLVHFDLKPENVLLAHCGLAKIADFGLTRVKVKTLVTRPNAQTPRYAAPELDPYRRPSKKVNQKVDIFAFGVMLKEVVEQEPSELKDLQTVPEVEEVKKEMHQLIGRCQNKEPDLRPTSNELVLELRCAVSKLREQRSVYTMLRGLQRENLQLAASESMLKKNLEAKELERKQLKQKFQNEEQELEKLKVEFEAQKLQLQKECRELKEEKDYLLEKNKQFEERQEARQREAEDMRRKAKDLINLIEGSALKDSHRSQLSEPGGIEEDHCQEKQREEAEKAEEAEKQRPHQAAALQQQVQAQRPQEEEPTVEQEEEARREEEADYKERGLSAEEYRGELKEEHRDLTPWERKQWAKQPDGIDGRRPRRFPLRHHVSPSNQCR
ncbi:hypothetical protein CYMTET_54018 [Cymbomonas tetramitiformis]|uniref:Protein kinase domain-containing protein n=1 Tax=Cymbomonas tetramitiformis TaxID=36881 RepID=A0AAE0BG41_9CHLO|nr:hypothetical protein CYMTET_54018 [Cymbomonas tetramitiformis]